MTKDEATMKTLAGQTAAIAVIAGILIEKGIVTQDEARLRFQNASLEHVLNLIQIDGKNARTDRAKQ